MRKLINKNECKQFAGKYFNTLKVSVLTIFNEEGAENFLWFGEIPEKKIEKYMSRITRKRENKGKYYYCFDFYHRETMCKHCFNKAGFLLPEMEEKLLKHIRDEAEDIFIKYMEEVAC